jgi:F-type H+-transporting ATPase subunit b
MTRHPRALAVLGGIVLAAGPARAAEGGLQLVPEPERLIFLLVLFLVLVPLLNGLLFKPLLGVLEERGRRIEGARARAAELSARAAALVAQHDDAVQNVRQAAHHERAQFVDEARRSHQGAIAGARAEAERRLAETRSEIGAALDSARTQLRNAAGPLAREAAERLLGRSLS